MGRSVGIAGKGQFVGRRRGLLFRWDLGSFTPGFGKTNGDCLLSAFDLLAASATQRAFLSFVHCAFDSFPCASTVFRHHPLVMEARRYDAEVVNGCTFPWTVLVPSRTCVYTLGPFL